MSDTPKTDTPRTDALELEMDGFSLGDAGSLFVELARELERQLPDGMKHCTIVFKECEKGHGWLTATNWVQHGCPTCALEELRESLAYAIGEADGWLYECRGKEKILGPEMDKARRLATAETPPPLSPPATPATVPAEPGSTG